MCVVLRATWNPYIFHTYKHTCFYYCRSNIFLQNLYNKIYCCILKYRSFFFDLLKKSFKNTKQNIFKLESLWSHKSFLFPYVIRCFRKYKHLSKKSKYILCETKLFAKQTSHWSGIKYFECFWLFTLWKCSVFFAELCQRIIPHSAFSVNFIYSSLHQNK